MWAFFLALAGGWLAFAIVEVAKSKFHQERRNLCRDRDPIGKAREARERAMKVLLRRRW